MGGWKFIIKHARKASAPPTSCISHLLFERKQLPTQSNLSTPPLSIVFLQIILGDRLLPCFKSPSGVPYADVNLKTGKAHAPRWGPDSSTSEVTTIQLEFIDLSRASGDPKYKVVFAMEPMISLPLRLTCGDSYFFF